MVEVASWLDARADLTAAVDIHTGVGGEFRMHLLRLHEPDLAPLPEDGVYQVSSKDPSLQQKLEEIIRSLRPDIVHTHRLQDLETIAPAVRRAGVRSLVHSLDTQTDPQYAVDPLRDIAELDGAGSVLLVTPGTVPPADFADDRTYVIRPGIDCARYRPGNAERARRKAGLPIGPAIVGCASPASHLDPLFEALVRDPDNIHVALFGPAVPTAAQKTAFRRLDIEDRIHVLGPWAGPELIYQAIDVYFHGPCENPIPRPVLAAQATGKRVIAAATVCSEALCPNASIQLPEQFAPALVSAIKEALSAANAASPRDFIETNWNAGRSMHSYGQLFHTLAAARRGQPVAAEAETPTAV